DIHKRQAFWGELRPWFSSKGYELYNYFPSPDPEEPSRLEIPSSLYLGVPELPYAQQGRRPEYRRMLQKIVEESELLSVFATEFMGRIHHAQDSQGRDVIVKPVKGGTDEILILQRLKAKVPLPSEKADFTGIIPVLDILPYEENFFVVMPRLDLQEGNILVNLAWSRHTDIDDDFYAESRERQKVVYAINDFDVSIIFPLETSLTECRLNFYESHIGVHDRPYGVRTCELDFNPFPYDVACLGIYLCKYFQVITILSLICN
ncbi:hypothetical protein BJ912DRAFT_868995, partial [Pholiota molesta]